MLNANGGGLDASTSRGFSSFASNQQGGNDGSYQQPGAPNSPDVASWGAALAVTIA